MREMPDRVFVDSGEVMVPSAPCLLHAGAIGSCVVVTAHDRVRSIGGMAHVMLPGEAADPADPTRTRYAADALDQLMGILAGMGANPSGLDVCLVGGADVIGRGDQGPGRATTASLLGLLADRGIVPVRTDLGGIVRRTCTLDSSTGAVLRALGDSRETVLMPATAEREGGTPDG